MSILKDNCNSRTELSTGWAYTHKEKLLVITHLMLWDSHDCDLNDLKCNNRLLFMVLNGEFLKHCIIQEQPLPFYGRFKLVPIEIEIEKGEV